MAPFWVMATFVVETLTMKLSSLDGDGLDIVFANGTDHNQDNVKGKHAPQKMRNAMLAAEPGAQRNEHEVKTDMSHILGKIFDEYRRKGSREPMTLLALTDGLWGGSTKKGSVERMIAEFWMCSKTGSIRWNLVTSASSSSNLAMTLTPLTVSSTWIRICKGISGWSKTIRLQDHVDLPLTDSDQGHDRHRAVQRQRRKNDTGESSRR